ncbi:MAG: ATP-dependent RecD-like DNA helicase [Clostridia bacterium]|nr:ATP-dependent RecD-like DNA helicase [Clostridia bacterium]
MPQLDFEERLPGDETITGFVDGVIYRNEENGYSVLDMRSEDELFTAVGSLAYVEPGEELLLSGSWVQHPTFGRQFKVQSFTRKRPKTAADMLRYLSGGTVKGVGPATAQKIVERFGEETFSVIENDPKLLSSIRGISMEKARAISESFRKQVAVREIMIYLERYGLTPTECLNIYKAYGSNAVERVTENPYGLCNLNIGISFARADEIASTLEETVNPVHRSRAGVLHVLSYNLSNGHTCLPRDRVIGPACELLSIGEEEVQSVIDDLIEDKALVEKDLSGRAFLFLPSMYLAEKNIAERMRVMLKFPPAQGRPVDADIDQIEQESGIQFEEKQRLAILTAVKKGVLVLTGGPGTGKTTTLNGILALYEKRKLNVLLAAPTGRAAKRMSEVTGREAKTLHRLLEVNFSEGGRQKFARNMEHPLEADAVIVDELSMVDVQLFWGLLNALPLGCRLIMVGDSDQLPPVGAGNVLHDIIQSELFPVVALTQVFRQAMESLIVTNAHRIVRGELPILDEKAKDFFFLPRDNVIAAASTVADLYCKRLPKAYGYDPLSDIQIICPSRKGETGTVNLNRALQQIMNPPSAQKEEITQGGRVFREGDKVMQIKNNYDILWVRGRESGEGVYNGDIGVIQTVNANTKLLKIQFDDKSALYPFDNLNELEHAYAITVHKSQGCEFDAVVMPVSAVVQQLCYRNLLYTAVTRAKQRIILVGSRQTVQMMTENDRQTKRYSALQYFLKEEEGENTSVFH